MKLLSTFLILLLSSIILISCSSKNKKEQKETLVFVHGANFTGESFGDLASHFKDFDTLLIDLPGRGGDGLAYSEVNLDLVAKFLCRKLESISGERTLIVHSQGGAVTNQAIGFCPQQITKVIYVAAVVPLSGEKPFAQLSKTDSKGYFNGVDLIKEKLELRISRPQKFVDTFAQDATAEQRKKIIKLAVSEPAAIGGSKLKFDKGEFESVKKFYIYTKKDLIVSYPTQLKFTKRVSFEKTHVMDSSHLPMVTHVKELAGVIRSYL